MYAAGYHPYVATASKNKSDPLEMVFLFVWLRGEQDLAYWIAFSKIGRDIILLRLLEKISNFKPTKKRYEMR